MFYKKSTSSEVRIPLTRGGERIGWFHYVGPLMPILIRKTAEVLYLQQRRTGLESLYVEGFHPHSTFKASFRFIEEPEKGFRIPSLREIEKLWLRHKKPYDFRLVVMNHRAEVIIEEDLVFLDFIEEE